MLGYLGSAFLIGLVMTLVVLGVAVAYLAVTGRAAPDGGALAAIVG